MLQCWTCSFLIQRYFLRNLVSSVIFFYLSFNSSVSESCSGKLRVMHSFHHTDEIY